MPVPPTQRHALVLQGGEVGKWFKGLSKGSCNIRISYHCSGILWVLNVLPHLRVYDPLAGCAGLAVVQLPAGEAVRHPLHRDVLVASQRQVAHPAAEVLHVPVSRTQYLYLAISSNNMYLVSIQDISTCPPPR